jgi:hypothetical protein
MEARQSEARQSLENPALFCYKKRRYMPEYNKVQKRLSVTNRTDLSSFSAQNFLLEIC